MADFKLVKVSGKGLEYLNQSKAILLAENKKGTNEAAVLSALKCFVEEKNE